VRFERTRRVGVTGSRAVVVALAANALCWLLFLLRPPVSEAELAAWDAEVRAGNFDRLGSEPVLVLSRTVDTSYFPSDAPLLFAYKCISLPGAFIGFQLEALISATFFSIHSSWLLARTDWIWNTFAGRSWLLGWSLFLGTSGWFALLGWGAATARTRAKRQDRNAGQQATG
jgi:hypothetical protein